LLLSGCAPAGVNWTKESGAYSVGVDGQARVRILGEGIQVLKTTDRQLWIRSPRAIKFEAEGKRTMALFPGLEFLEGEERSSSDRDARGLLADRRRPEPWKVTVPLMAYEVDGFLIMVLWKQDALP